MEQPVFPRSPISLTAVAVVSAPGGYALGLLVGSRWLLPLLVGLPAWLVMAALIRRGNDRLAVVTMLLWALALGAATTIGPLVAPERAATAVFHGVAYRAEMFHWIATGEGAEGSPAQFLPQHLLHLGIFLAAAIATGGVAAMVFGSALMGYMGFYVAGVIANANHPWWGAVLGWHPWSLLRVAGFVILGVALGTRGIRGKEPLRSERLWLCIGTGLIAADVLVKALLAPWWRSLLVVATAS